MRMAVAVPSLESAMSAPSSCTDHPIREARKRKGFTLRELSALACVEYSKISRAEHGLQLKPAELLRLSGVLGVTPAALEPGAADV